MADLGFDFTDDDYEKEDNLTNDVVETIPTIKEPLPSESNEEEDLLADEKWTPAERVYAFKEGDILIHRLLLAKELPNALEELGTEASVQHVIPIMEKLSSDSDDTVRETFSSELDQILLYFYKNTPCTFTRKEDSTQDKSFAPLMITILLDQNSAVASLGQQAIITVVSMLRENDMKDLIDSEIHKGLIDGLMAIVDGKSKRPHFEDRRVSIDNEIERRRSSTPGFESTEDEFDQGEVSLAKIKVRCTFAHSLHDIARIIGPERTERDLVQIFALYLMDLDDVKQGVLEHLADFLGTLAVSSRNEYIPILAEVWDGVATNWHLRNILARQLREISLLFDASRVVEHVLPLVVRACHDEFAAVRQTGVGVFPVILDVVRHAVEEDGESLSQADGYGDDVVENKKNFALALLSHVMERLDEFARSNHYRGRLV
ncbi:hypothetical protein RMCBS344292_06411 [Rhizopus microsporus]|nr:hypothetical protein RMCBS344292_06411 [Rhizopus microsporus]